MFSVNYKRWPPLLHRSYIIILDLWATVNFRVVSPLETKMKLYLFALCRPGCLMWAIMYVYLEVAKLDYNKCESQHISIGIIFTYKRKVIKEIKWYFPSHFLFGHDCSLHNEPVVWKLQATGDKTTQKIPPKCLFLN